MATCGRLLGSSVRSWSTQGLGRAVRYLCGGILKPSFGPTVNHVCEPRSGGSHLPQSPAHAKTDAPVGNILLAARAGILWPRRERLGYRGRRLVNQADAAIRTTCDWRGPSFILYPSSFQWYALADALRRRPPHPLPLLPRHQPEPDLRAPDALGAAQGRSTSSARATSRIRAGWRRCARSSSRPRMGCFG